MFCSYLRSSKISQSHVMLSVLIVTIHKHGFKCCGPKIALSLSKCRSINNQWTWWINGSILQYVKLIFFFKLFGWHMTSIYIVISWNMKNYLSLTYYKKLPLSKPIIRREISTILVCKKFFFCWQQVINCVMIYE
jgi:hypothetical protein